MKTSVQVTSAMTEIQIVDHPNRDQTSYSLANLLLLVCLSRQKCNSVAYK
jgi:hypothetical protein